ncbi:MAG: adenylosuccinate lyase [Firmicutes bacterium]|nr:adenylosuccinate lyase [Bacillota bacterium]
MTDHSQYVNPLTSRYAGAEMSGIFSDGHKFGLWRRLWLALARSERRLGLDISEAQLQEMAAHLDDINYDSAARWERELRHDVMAHIRAWGEQCPAARPIIHLGATSAYVVDNADIIRMREGLLLLRRRLLGVMRALAAFADRYKDTVCLAYTHFQPAQPTTVGKRACLWLQDLLLDVERLDQELSTLRLLGCKGATGTAASFLHLFGGDGDKVARLEELIAAEMGFSACYPVSGQTYSRKVDYSVLSVLSGIAQSGAKFANDVRLLCHEGELAEPFESSQVGSSAMAYKRNPMRCERMDSLARFIIAAAANPAYTAATQWLERTLDDSANKRISVAEAFLAADGLLALYANVAAGLQVYPAVIARHLAAELPFMATENILMQAVEQGGDRQDAHEAIREHTLAAREALRQGSGGGDLLQRLAADPRIGLSHEELEQAACGSSLSGLAAEQTAALLNGHILPLLADSREEDAPPAEILV